MMKLYNVGVRNIYFYLIYLASLSFSKPIYKNYPKLHDFLFLSNRNQVRGGYPYNPKTIGKFLKAYLRRPDLLSRLFLDIKRRKKSIFEKYQGQFIQKDLEKLSSQKLFSYYQEFFTLLRRLFYLNQVIWTLDISGSIFLKEKLKKFSPENINLITQPDEINYLGEERRAFLRLCLRYFKNKKSSLDNLLDDHLKKFAYISISYFNEPPKKKKDYLKIIKEMTKKGGIIYIKNLLKEEENNFKAKIKKRNLLFIKIKDSKSRKAVLLLRKAAYLKDWFRGSVSEIIYFFLNPLLKEMAKRIGLKEDEIKYLIDRELKRFILRKKIDRGIIKKRQGYYAIRVFHHKFFLFYGNKAKSLERKYFPAIKISVKKLTGVPAEKGQVKGRVKIILTAKDFKKFKKNDILVSTNTMPEFMPVLRKAKAIITDIGGITSHAAIVSRELRIPCIIGTKIATMVLKDGDLVEVDANKGMVRIIKS